MAGECFGHWFFPDDGDVWGDYLIVSDLVVGTDGDFGDEVEVPACGLLAQAGGTANRQCLQDRGRGVVAALGVGGV